jgi:methionine sulfoxide reductase catalytic subunit
MFFGMPPYTLHDRLIETSILLIAGRSKVDSKMRHTLTNTLIDTMDCSEVTPERVYQQRRLFLIKAVSLGLIGTLWPSSFLHAKCNDAKLVDVNPGDKLNSWQEITGYNNYYEFSTNKEAVAALAQGLTTHPWTLSVEGEVESPTVFDVDALLSTYPQEDRTYRLRCVEGWSMVIPWQGFSLCRLLEKVKPLPSAQYVEFTSMLRPTEMLGQRQHVLSWPYTEGLRIDEAMHPLTLLATGLYSKRLPKQNGAPIRLVVPWKYGFKSIKALSTIRLTTHAPITSWMKASPGEYGFYANVNPEVAHPRWNQRREVRIGHLKKQKTLPFNGYAKQVSSLYQNMDLKKHF